MILAECEKKINELRFKKEDDTKLREELAKEEALNDVLDLQMEAYIRREKKNQKELAALERREKERADISHQLLEL